MPALAIKGGVRAESVVQGENRLTDIDIAFEQQAERTGFSVGAEYEGSPLAATGDLASRDGRTEISLASARRQPSASPCSCPADRHRHRERRRAYRWADDPGIDGYGRRHRYGRRDA
ncbi:hypothetical protein F2981_04325 [Sinorhizobium meliloti]|nr:hypothetical protein [Sinorhizobium meliloti]